MEVPKRLKISTEEILGFTKKGNCLYEAFSPGQTRVQPSGIKYGRYIGLYGSRDVESAKELTVDGKKHGAFTYLLLKLLEQSGPEISYSELMRRVEMEMQDLVNAQTPVLVKTNFQDGNLSFLSNQFVVNKPTFEVIHQKRTGQWIINVGRINGLVPSGPEIKTTVKLTDEQGEERIIEVMEVKEFESILNAEGFRKEDENTIFTAVIHQMDFPRMNIGFSPTLSEEQQTEIISAWEQIKDSFNYINLIVGATPLDYEIKSQPIGNGSYAFILTSAGGDLPLFNPQHIIGAFFGDVEKVGKRASIIKLMNLSSTISTKDFQIDIEVLEGVPFDAYNFHEIISREWPRKEMNPESVTTRYIDGIQPAIKIKLSNLNSNKSYWVGALYADSRFGITDQFLEVQEIGKKSRSSVDLIYSNQEQRYRAIPLEMSEWYQTYEVSTITDYLIVFVANQKFDLHHFVQQPVGTNPMRGLAYRGAIPRDDWRSIVIPIKIIKDIPRKEPQINYSTFKAPPR